MTILELEFPGALSCLTAWSGEWVSVVVRSSDGNSFPLLAQMSGTLKVSWENADGPGERISSPMVLAFEEHDSSLRFDPSTFRGAQRDVAVLTILIGAVVLEVSTRPAGEPNSDVKAATDEDGTDESSGLSLRRFRRVSRCAWCWVHDNVLKTLAAAVITVGLATLATLTFVVPSEHPKLRVCPSTVSSNGSITQAGTRILKRVDSRNAYLFDNGVLEHIPNESVYYHNIGCFPVQFNVSDSRLRSYESGPNAHSPTGTQLRIGPKLLRSNYLLRELGGKRSWQIIDGRRVPITSVGVFNCLAKRDLVWDAVRPTEAKRFPRDKALRRAHCSGSGSVGS